MTRASLLSTLQSEYPALTISAAALRDGVPPDTVFYIRRPNGLLVLDVADLIDGGELDSVYVNEAKARIDRMLRVG